MKVVPEQGQIVNKGLFWLVTDVLGIVAGPDLKWDPTSITLAQIKKKIEDLREYMNAILHSDFMAAFCWLESASICLKQENYESAFENIQKLRKHTISTYSQVKTFEKKVFCKKLSVFSLKMISCYNQETKFFDDITSLSEKKQRAIAKEVTLDIDTILSEFDKIKEPSWWQRKVNKAKTKKEEQDVLDGLLKAALPIIWHQNELFKLNNYRDEVMLKYLPYGKEDAAEILLEGKWPIRVWKHGCLCFEFQNKNAVDEGIKFTNFRSIASNPLCKYFTKKFYFVKSN